MDWTVRDILDGENLEVPDILLDYEEISEKYEEVEQKSIQAIQATQKRENEHEQQKLMEEQNHQEKKEYQDENTRDKDSLQNRLRIPKGYWITFYVAECGEYHHLREYDEYDSLEKAVVAYKKIRDNGSCHYYGNIFRIIYHDSTDGLYGGGEYPFITGDTIRAGNLDDVRHFAESTLICRDVAQIHEFFSD